MVRKLACMHVQSVYRSDVSKSDKLNYGPPPLPEVDLYRSNEYRTLKSRPSVVWKDLGFGNVMRCI